MGKKEKRDEANQQKRDEANQQKKLGILMAKVQPRRAKGRERRIFERIERSKKCLAHLEVKRIDKLNDDDIRNHLAYCCATIEHQIVALRRLTILTKKDLNERRFLTQSLINCLYKHHGVIYEGIMFGSTINGLGFRDSDIDLRLRPLRRVAHNTLEPVNYDRELIDKTLQNIAFHTTRCASAMGEFIPSVRCPIAKLTFLTGDLRNLNSYEGGAKYDISLSSVNNLGTFNSIYMRFLCRLQPKFHLLATVLRYWSKTHELIVSGYLSSYALVNMLIMFCQTTSPPLLPSVDQMRDIYLAEKTHLNDKDEKRALLQLEWNCMISLDKDSYPPSANKEPVSVLLLKFFEMYLNFPYSTHIMTTRPGRALALREFEMSPQYHPKFPVKKFMNVQDPFDLKHNLTSGMNGPHFQTLMVTMRYSYERLCRELLANFTRPVELKISAALNDSEDDSQRFRGSDRVDEIIQLENWGLNSIFVRITNKEMGSAC